MQNMRKRERHRICKMEEERDGMHREKKKWNE